LAPNQEPFPKWRMSYLVGPRSLCSFTLQREYSAYCIAPSRLVASQTLRHDLPEDDHLVRIHRQMRRLRLLPGPLQEPPLAGHARDHHANHLLRGPRVGAPRSHQRLLPHGGPAGDRPVASALKTLKEQSDSRSPTPSGGFAYLVFYSKVLA
jgi:hypothetical protein